MSTENLHLDLVTFINDEPLDMLDEFTADEIANICISVAMQIEHGSKYICRQMFSRTSKKGYGLKVNNTHGGFVSVSSPDSTGVSYTEYYPYYTDDPEDGAFVGLCSLASMINEAWYLCTSQGDNLGKGVL